MGVNNEKEPLSGTTPERRLFDRSLVPLCNMRTSHTLIKIETDRYQLVTHNTCRAVILVSNIGMVPVRLLLLSRLFLHKFQQDTMLRSKIFNCTKIIELGYTKHKQWKAPLSYE